MAALGAVGGLLMALPLLYAVATQQSLWGLGPFGASWWVPMAAVALGLGVVIAALVRLIRALRLAARGGDAGYGWLTLATVATDQSRDAGFALLGARGYGGLDAQDRGRLLLCRILAGLLFLGAVLWVPVALLLVLVAGFQGWLGPRTAWLVTLAPAGALLALGVVVKALQGTLEREARNRRRQQGGPADGWATGAETVAWNEAYDGRHPEPALGRGSTGRGLPLRAGALVAALLLALLAAATAVFVASATVGPLLAYLATPNMGSIQMRAAAQEPLRDYRSSETSTLDPATAGRLAHALTLVGTAGADDLLQPPDPALPDRLFPDRPPAGRLDASRGAWIYIRRAHAGDLSAEERAAMAAVAAHPVFAVLDSLRGVHAADLAGGRFVLPLPDSLAFFELPIPRFGATRDVGYGAVIRAAHQLSEGDTAGAEATLHAAIDMGFLFLDEGLTVIENLIGMVVTQTAAAGLAELYVVTGREADGRLLHALVQLATDVPDRLRPLTPRADASSTMARMADHVGDERLLRGMRWESLVMLSALGPCANPRRILFGGEEASRELQETALTELARYPAERALVEFAQRGMLPTSQVAERGPIARGLWRLFGELPATRCAVLLTLM